MASSGAPQVELSMEELKSLPQIEEESDGNLVIAFEEQPSNPLEDSRIFEDKRKQRAKRQADVEELLAKLGKKQRMNSTTLPMMTRERNRS